MKEKGSADGKNHMSSLKGVRIRTFSLWMIICTIFVSVLIGKGIFDVMDHHSELAAMTKEYLMTQDQVMNLSLGSDYLTEQARLYVAGRDFSYVEDYFKEADETKRRERALKEIEKNLENTDSQALRTAEEGMALSNELMDLEIHAMKLAALSKGEDLGRFPQKIQEYELSEEEMRADPEEKAAAASQLVFGRQYQDRKHQIEDKLAEVIKDVTADCDRKQEESEKSMKNALIRQSLYTILVVILIILSYIMIAVLILRPIRIYVNCIKNKNYLEITGAYEFKYFAATYNNVYEMSLVQQDLLRQKAERDALTGLLNRQAFEQLKEKLRMEPVSIALLLIDIDIFKSINDNYGHEIGDQALKKTAALLEESFRTSDYVLRIGGDEFAVIMENVQSDRKKIISDKINRINYELQHPEDGLPVFTISTGAAFSDHGYFDELFRQADQALYQTKENGRCGYSFYDS